MKIKSFALCVIATAAVAGMAWTVMDGFQPNYFAVGLVVLLFSYGLYRYFQKPQMRLNWRRSVIIGIVAVSLAAPYIYLNAKLLPPPTYENAHYIIDKTDYRYWLHNSAYALIVPEYIGGVLSIGATDFLTRERNRRDIGFVPTFLMSTFYGLFCVLKVLLVAWLVYLFSYLFVQPEPHKTTA